MTPKHLGPFHGKTLGKLRQGRSFYNWIASFREGLPLCLLHSRTGDAAYEMGSDIYFFFLKQTLTNVKNMSISCPFKKEENPGSPI